MTFSKNKYNEMLASVKSNTETKTDNMTDLLNELGIKKSTDNEFKLIIWNDHVNNMFDVILALYEVCKLSATDAERVMTEAHNKGKAIVKTGSKEELSII